MARKHPDLTAIHRKADKIEPRVARASVKSAATLRARVPVTELTLALAGDNLEAAAQVVLAELDTLDPYTPVARILEDTVIKGGRLAEDEINEELS